MEEVTHHLKSEAIILKLNLIANSSKMWSEQNAFINITTNAHLIVSL